MYQKIKLLQVNCILLTTAPFFIKYPSLTSLIVLVVPAEPDRLSESLE